MLRLAAFAVLLGAVTCQMTDSPLVEYLRNFENPLLGNAVNNLIDNIQSGVGSDTQGEGDIKTDDGYESGNRHTYVFSRWTEFGLCSKVCGGGVRTRSRKCLDETGAEYPLGKCFTAMSQVNWDMFTLLKARKQMKEVDEEICNTSPCRTTEWQYPTTCSHECGGGMMSYSRVCLDSVDQSLCNFQKKKLVRCNKTPCFRVGEWRRWSRCTSECGGGQKSRSRSCMPNVDPYSPLYSKLQYALQHVGKSNHLLSTESRKEQLYYLNQYMRECGSKTVETGLCNLHSCPSCPKNQQYYHCKPCMRICRKVDLTNLEDLEFRLPDFDRSATGCGGECVAGCGCPFMAPLMGYDESCYALDLLCPQNQVSPNMHTYLMLQLLMNKQEERAEAEAARALTSTTEAPTTKQPRRKPGRRKPQTKPPTEEVPSYYSQSPATDSGEGYAYSVATDPPQGVTYAPEPTYAPARTSNATDGLSPTPICPYETFIMPTAICECKHGYIIELPGCFRTSPTDEGCPRVCKKKYTCPKLKEPRTRSDGVCLTPHCNNDNDCNHIDMCCELDCGRRCVSPHM